MYKKTSQFLFLVVISCAAASVLFGIHLTKQDNLVKNISTLNADFESLVSGLLMTFLIFSTGKAQKCYASNIPLLATNIPSIFLTRKL